MIVVQGLDVSTKLQVAELLALTICQGRHLRPMPRLVSFLDLMGTIHPLGITAHFALDGLDSGELHYFEYVALVREAISMGAVFVHIGEPEVLYSRQLPVHVDYFIKPMSTIKSEVIADIVALHENAVSRGSFMRLTREMPIPKCTNS